MAHCVRHEQCPKCAKLGKDRTHDNLAVYSDGSKYCFSCHYHISATGIGKIREESIRLDVSIALPNDSEPDLPQKAIEYLDKFGITKRDIQSNTLLWSEYWQRLVFPYFGDNGLLGWQGRYLGEEQKPKWYSQGNLRDLIHVVGNKHAGQFVVVEDVLSAIKIAHCPEICAVPLFGSHVDVKKILTLKKLLGTIKVWCWLDLDKQKESAQYSKKLRDLGFDARSIITELDPKCYNDEQIREILDYG